MGRPWHVFAKGRSMRGCAGRTPSMGAPRFNTVAYLQQTWWFEVAGQIDFCFPVGAYSLFFRLHLGLPSKRFGRRICNSEHIHGWDKNPVKFQPSTSNSQKVLSPVLFE